MIAGQVIDAETGLPVANVTVWKTNAGSTTAEVVGQTDNAGNFSVDAGPNDSMIFAADGYQNINYNDFNRPLTTILIEPETAVTATLKFSGNTWLLIIGGLLLLFLNSKKK